MIAPLISDRDTSTQHSIFMKIYQIAGVSGGCTTVVLGRLIGSDQGQKKSGWSWEDFPLTLHVSVTPIHTVPRPTSIRTLASNLLSSSTPLIHTFAVRCPEKPLGFWCKSFAMVWEETCSSISHFKVMTLNVGGETFATSGTTLLRVKTSSNPGSTFTYLSFH